MITSYESIILGGSGKQDASDMTYLAGHDVVMLLYLYGIAIILMRYRRVNRILVTTLGLIISTKNSIRRILQAMRSGNTRVKNDDHEAVVEGRTQAAQVSSPSSNDMAIKTTGVDIDLTAIQSTLRNRRQPTWLDNPIMEHITPRRLRPPRVDASQIQHFLSRFRDTRHEILMQLDDDALHPTRHYYLLIWMMLKQLNRIMTSKSEYSKSAGSSKSDPTEIIFSSWTRSSNISTSLTISDAASEDSKPSLTRGMPERIHDPWLIRQIMSTECQYNLHNGICDRK